MRYLALYFVAAPLVLWFAYRALTAALDIARRDAKEAAALAVARKGGGYGRAYSTWNAYKCHLVSSSIPWRREENL